MRSFLTFLLLALLFGSASANAPTDLYASAAAAYEKGDFQSAHDTWLSIIDEHGIAADLFYNLGNASHRLGNTGEAALWYQRALVIDPSHAESAQNLKVLERQVGSLPLATNPLRNLADSIMLRHLIIAAAFAFWAVVLSFTVAGCLQHSRPGLIHYSIRTLGIIVLALSITALIARRSPESLRERSIVIAANSTARTAPADDSKEVISLPPGTQVNRLAERASWSYLAIPGELRGWIHSEEAAPLWPFDASFLR